MKTETLPAVGSTPLFDNFAGWRKFADDCDRAAGKAERMASETDCQLEKARWRGHADNFANTARRTRDILSNASVLAPAGEGKEKE